MYAVYLRKSRADIEAEAHGEGETLARHEKTLKELAKKLKLPVGKIYKEIVSGENIAARPQMQKLLADVNDAKYDGVIVMEIERLARGDTIDQGVVAQAFRDSDTKIITPTKTYDPNNEFDEEYFEFSLFMSRREYKTIKRRMNAGRLAAVKEGNYIGTYPPFGYKKISPSPKVHTLEVIPEEAEVVRLIYDTYLHSDTGCSLIATKLNQMGIKPQRNNAWQPETVKALLHNPVYAGLLRWRTKGLKDELFQGLHEPIISKEDFNKAQYKFERSPHNSKHKRGLELKNYYQGILFCSNCGRAMSRKKHNNHEYIHCHHFECREKVVCSRIEAVDELVIFYATKFYNDLKQLKNSAPQCKVNNLNTEKLLTAELTKLEKQQNKLYDLLENGVYDNNTFIERSKLVKDKISDVKKQLRTVEQSNTEIISNEEMLDRLENVILNFGKQENAEIKNKMLKTVIRRIEYSKTKKLRENNGNSDLEISVEFII